MKKENLIPITGDDVIIINTMKENVTINLDGTINIPLNTRLNLIVGKKIRDNELKAYVVKEIIIKGENLVEELTDVNFIEPEIIINDLNNNIPYLVMGSDIQLPREYQLLEYDFLNGFTSNKRNYHY